MTARLYCQIHPGLVFRPEPARTFDNRALPVMSKTPLVIRVCSICRQDLKITYESEVLRDNMWSKYLLDLR